MKQPPAPSILQPCVYPEKKNKTVKANELVHLCVYQESKLLLLLSSPAQLGSKRVFNFCRMHDSPEKQTLTQVWLLKDVDYVNFFGMTVVYKS